MKLKLINFKCYTEKTFEFDDNSFILISAPSGAGKSTILLAIQYVLYGIGSNVKYYGKTNCSVEFEYDGMRIVRTKRKRVVINDEYEDEIAQSIINKKFGENFDVTSYIAQLSLNSFILMNPTNKLEFLENFAFKDVNISDIKNKCKNLILQKNEELNKTMYQLDIAINILKELNEPEEIKFPFNCKDKIMYEKNEHVKNSNCDKRIKDSNKRICKIQNEINDLNILNSYIESKKDVIDSLCDELENLTIEEKNILYIGDKTLDNYKKRLEIRLSLSEYNFINNKYKEDLCKLELMKFEEVEKYKKEILHIDSNIWKEYSREECEISIKDTKDILKDAKRVSFLKKQINPYITLEELEDLKIKLEDYRVELDDRKKLLETIRQQCKIYACPSCKSKLYLNDDILCVNSKEIDNDIVIDETEIKNEIKILNRKIQKLELNIPSEENKILHQEKIKNEIESINSEYEDDINEISIEEDLEILENYYKTQIRLESKKQIIEESLLNEEFSASFKLFEKDILILKQNLDKLNTVSDCKEGEQYSEKELRNIITSEQNKKESIERLGIKIKKINQDNLKYNKQVQELKEKHICKYTIIKNTDELNVIIEDNKSIIKENEDKKEKCIQNIEDIEKYNNYIVEKDKFKSLKNKIKYLEDKEIEDKKN